MSASSHRRKRHTPEQVVAKLREAEAMLASGKTIAQVCRALAVSEVTYHRWKGEYGGMKEGAMERLKGLEEENRRLKRAVADLTLDKQILKAAIDHLGNG